jgi:hypothetical protein
LGETAFTDILNRHGVTHPNAFRVTSDAVACFSEMAASVEKEVA